MEISTQNLPAGALPGEFQVSSRSETITASVTARAVTIPNSLEICSRALGDVASPIMADSHRLQPGDIILSRARTLSMHSIIALGQIYKFSWDTDNSFRFWSHPAMIVAVAGQTLRNAQGTKQGTVMDDVLVQATVNPKGVNYALLKDFRKAYSSRCWIFSPQRFDKPISSKDVKQTEIGAKTIRAMVVEHAQIESGKSLFEWLEENSLLADVSTLPSVTPLSGLKPQEPRHFTYGMLSLASILVSQIFQKWRFRFFNEGQVTCSGFIAELMEKANYVFPSEIHAFPADVAEQIYLDFQDHNAMKQAEASKVTNGDQRGWIKGVAHLRKQISDDRKVMLKNAGSFRMSRRALTALLTMVGIAGLFGWAILAWIWPLVQDWPWLIRVVLAGISIYAIAVAAPIAYYAGRAFLKVSLVGIPQLIAMLRPLYWRRPGDLE